MTREFAQLSGSCAEDTKVKLGVLRCFSWNFWGVLATLRDGATQNRVDTSAERRVAGPGVQSVKILFPVERYRVVGDVNNPQLHVIQEVLVGNALRLAYKQHRD